MPRIMVLNIETCALIKNIEDLEYLIDKTETDFNVKAII